MTARDFDRLADEYIAVQRREAVLAVLEQLRVEVEGLPWWYDGQSKRGDKPIYLLGEDVLALIDKARG